MYVEEAEWAIEVMKATGLPVAMCLNICLAGDFEGVSVEECAVRIAKAGKRWNSCFISFLFSANMTLRHYFSCSQFLKKVPTKRVLITLSFISSSLL